MEKDKETSDKPAAPKEDKVEAAQNIGSQNTGSKEAAKQVESQAKDKKVGKEPAKTSKPKTGKAVAVSKSEAHSSRINKAMVAVAGLALLLGGAAVFGVFYNNTQWQSMAHKEQSIVDEQVKLASALNDVRSQIGELNTHNSELKSQIDSTNQSIDRNRDQQAAMQVSLEHVQELTQQKGHIPVFWKYAEVEYLLTVANHRLLLERDIDTALLALLDADAKIKAIGDPALIPIRGLIADEVSALNSVERPDLPGMSARLRSLVEGIEQLPLISKEHILTITTQDQKDREIDSWTELPGTIWKDIKSLVEIKRNDGHIEPLLPPDERHYLSQNLGLKLEESRIALLNRDTAVFRQNLSDTREWIERYFDKESFAVTNVVSTVNELESIELKPKLPDISGSLRQLRDWVEQYKNQKNASLRTQQNHNMALNINLDSVSSQEKLPK